MAEGSLPGIEFYRRNAMSDRMLVTQALDERDLLAKKIRDKIAKAGFVDTIRPNEDKALDSRATREEFARQAEAAYQQIQDLTDRFQRIDAAIVASNAQTKINTSYGEFTIAGAVSLRSRLRGSGSYDGEIDFESALRIRMEEELHKGLSRAEQKNRQLQTTAESMRLSILGRETRVKDEKPLEVVDAYVRENTTELVDPLNIRNKIEKLREKRDTLLTELDTQIKVSNATTFVTV